MLAVEGLDAFYGRAQILRGVTLAVDAGEVLVLAGRNGAGKSTTLKAIMGLVAPAAGRISFEGRDIAGLPPYRIARAGIGYVPEDRRIFTELTVAENLAVGRQATRGGAAWSEAQLFGVFPNLGLMRDRPGGRMSGGEQQMLAIARTLMGNPRLILLDEPSEGLAPVIVAQMADAIRALKAAGVGILLAEQNLRFAAGIADRAAVIEKGTIVWTGAMDTLMGDAALRAAHLSV
jgi:branched-chain amino acid transport system ATP-binding protein